MKTQCIICDSTRINDFVSELKKCVNCGLVFVNADITDEEIRKIYQKDYFFGGEYVDYVRAKSALQLNSRGRLRDLLRYVDSPRQKYLFEIDCT